MWERCGIGAHNNEEQCYTQKEREVRSRFDQLNCQYRRNSLSTCVSLHHLHQVSLIDNVVREDLALSLLRLLPLITAGGIRMFLQV